jgi:hypothetical protein
VLELLLPERNMKKSYQSMTAEELRVEYDRIIREHLTLAIENIPRTVASLINEAIGTVVAKETGLRRCYGTWEMSYGQKDGEFVRLVKDAATQYIRDNAEDLTRVYLAPLTKEDTRELKGAYRTQLYRAVEERMEEKAQQECEAVVARLLGTSNES